MSLMADELAIFYDALPKDMYCEGGRIPEPAVSDSDYESDQTTKRKPVRGKSAVKTAPKTKKKPVSRAKSAIKKTFVPKDSMPIRLSEFPALASPSHKKTKTQPATKKKSLAINATTKRKPWPDQLCPGQKEWWPGKRGAKPKWVKEQELEEERQLKESPDVKQVQDSRSRSQRMARRDVERRKTAELAIDINESAVCHVQSGQKVCSISDRSVQDHEEMQKNDSGDFECTDFQQAYEDLLNDPVSPTNPDITASVEKCDKVREFQF